MELNLWGINYRDRKRKKFKTQATDVRVFKKHFYLKTEVNLVKIKNHPAYG